nr:transposase [uncultured Sunxiuqinia sp.]
MKKEELLNDDFLKQFKSGEELNDFLKQIQKRGIEKMLEGELDCHLGYDKHQKSDNPNGRNGFTEKNFVPHWVKVRFRLPVIVIPPLIQ